MVYFFLLKSLGRVKIGYSQPGGVESRVLSLRTASPDADMLVKSTDGTQFDEQRLHRRFMAAWIHGEWFSMNDEVTEYIDSLSGEWHRVEPTANLVIGSMSWGHKHAAHVCCNCQGHGIVDLCKCKECHGEGWIVRERHKSQIKSAISRKRSTKDYFAHINDGRNDVMPENMYTRGCKYWMRIQVGRKLIRKPLSKDFKTAVKMCSEFKEEVESAREKLREAGQSAKWDEYRRSLGIAHNSIAEEKS